MKGATMQQNDPSATEISNEELLHLFRRCSHMQHAMGGTHGQGRLLTTLARQGSMPQHKLAAATDRTAATLSQQLDILEAEGLVEREKDATDRRSINVRLTEDGQHAAQAAAEQRSQEADALFGSLDERDRTDLYRILDILEKQWSQLDHRPSHLPDGRRLYQPRPPMTT